MYGASVTSTRPVYAADQLQPVAQRDGDLDDRRECRGRILGCEQPADDLWLRGDGSCKVGLRQAELLTGAVERANDLVDGVDLCASLFAVLGERRLRHLRVEELAETGLGGARHVEDDSPYEGRER